MQISRAPIGIPKPPSTTRTTKNSLRAASAEPFAVAPAPKTNPHSNFGASQPHEVIQEEITVGDTTHSIPNDGDAASEGKNFTKLFNVDTEAATR